jgi:GcrA cell cycle regulator
MLETRPVFHEDVVVPMSLRVTIVELKEAMCRWPLGDPTSSEFRYCGSPSSGVGPYCAHHSKLAYQPVQDRRRERERERRALAR